MTLKRIILGILTAIAIALVGLSLLASWSEPQIQSRLELYQTNLLLHASEWQGENNQGANLSSARNNIIGSDPLNTALTQYKDARDSTQKTLETTQAQFKQIPPTLVSKSENSALKSAQQKAVQELTSQQSALLNELDLRLGVLQASSGKTKEAIQTWQGLVTRYKTEIDADPSVVTAQVLTGIWSNPPQLLPDAEPRIQKSLDGWFRYRALAQLYKLQERSKELVALQAAEQVTAEQAIEKLAIVVGVPAISLCIGTVLLVGLSVQWLLQRQQLDKAGSGPLLARNASLTWDVPWDGEIVWQVLVVGFFFVGQILIPYFLLPVSLAVLKLNPATFDGREKAFYIFATYLLLSAGGLSVLYFSVKSFLPLPDGWFRIDWRGNWFLWGFGGYFVALPLVVVVSLINQQLWQGQGGSNPILPIVLEGRDNVALAVFFGTAAIAAPVFEEIVFRGFLLPSLTRYLPVSGAIAASAFLFAVAHLSVSEILPLATLGAVLGFVYTRSRNLLAPMLLHSLWNSGTLLSLFLLGGSAG
ncbi:MAG: CPBP family intramembrane metalloprotease [Microcoleus sp. PH2017_29_MFU_D_A]|uniref:type II CAAX endopeptidase family protein n=1 Tax=unclassified Microcoleus TaxID=2642155 RepID=UPI001E04DCE3|nr:MULTISPECIES: type II CAAX endopeptidase family protein [unclassified Microcoleus]MCC3417525.1 CPBP family intramembrane metalloprotease [Microcoleus sp. PH2017_07_MST_O_A]MCC3430277.1 CPBP family intramembrane metalloprotease [Microcoleus sp. PH2017_04_SCI_O_A]MCC3464903.1 CPBP family intramembrane metalloprotease [Microcoleus sp. PH2017_06_SFM_O_A]MCC3504991.1 CPBP family intramembrane metalloprotease [Microcoleus sp. PH2017_19_SFW_U_A]MCC3508020.1 CPBP family intramembrane metalloproteas